MTHAKVPSNARIFYVEGSKRPSEVTYSPIVPYKMLWVVTNGSVRRKFLWVTVRKTGIYVAFGGQGSIHSSYHADGTHHLKANKKTVSRSAKPPLASLVEPVLIQNGAVTITDEVLASRYKLSVFDDQPVDRVVYLDNRKLPDTIEYFVWAVPAFRHDAVPLFTDRPAQIHVVTHTNPWIEVVICE